MNGTFKLLIALLFFVLMLALFLGGSGQTVKADPAVLATITPISKNYIPQIFSCPKTNLLLDPSFEAYRPNPFWLEFSTNFGSPLCTIADCASGGSTAVPRTGAVWAWFGGTEDNETGSLRQNVVFPRGGVAELRFYLWIQPPPPGSGADDVFFVQIDGATLFITNATQAAQYPGYTLVSVNVGAYANGASHQVLLGSVTSGQVVNFHVDDVSLSCS